MDKIKTIEELRAELDEIESDEFLLKMKDHWSGSDYDRSAELSNRKKEISNQIAEMEGLV